MTNFPGIGLFIDEVLDGVEGLAPVARHRIGDDGLLHEIGDLLGQACAHAPRNREAAAAIVACVAERVEVLRLRLAAAEASLGFVLDVLDPPKPKKAPARNPEGK